MPEFHACTTTPAPIEEVWKLLVDPTRYPEWWAGIAAIEQADGSSDGFTLYHPDEPALPWPQEIERRSDDRLVISCMTSAMRYEWQLGTADGETRIDAHVEIPDDWAGHLESQRDLIRRSLAELAVLAERSS
ncbi:MAG: SRPBCC family protein [Solirubrobacteraceae bacterium]